MASRACFVCSSAGTPDCAGTDDDDDDAPEPEEGGEECPEETGEEPASISSLLRYIGKLFENATV